MAVAALNSLCSVAKEISHASFKGAVIGTGIGISIGALIHQQETTTCSSSSDLRFQWICYMHTGLAKYAVIPLCAAGGCMVETAYGIYK